MRVKIAEKTIRHSTLSQKDSSHSPTFCSCFSLARRKLRMLNSSLDNAILPIKDNAA